MGFKLTGNNKSRQALLENALQHETVHNQIKELDAVKSTCKNNISELLTFLGVDKQDFPSELVDGKMLRTQFIFKKQIQYDDDKLLKLLKSKDKIVFKRAVILSVDYKELDALYNEGVLTYDEIQDCVTGIKETKAVDVRRVKATIKEEANGR